jgi:hypothetical protein
MSERPEPDIDRVREAMRDHDERVQDDREDEEEQPEQQQDDEQEGE